MKLCSNDHDEVCFDGWKCPVCDREDEMEALKKRVDELEIECTGLLEQIAAQAIKEIKHGNQ